MKAAESLEVLHPIGQRILSLTYPGRLDNHPCLIRPLRITATYIFCFCHMDALDEVLCALLLCRILVHSAPTRVRGNLCLERAEGKMNITYLLCTSGPP